MTQAMRLRARMRYQLRQATTKVKEMSVGVRQQHVNPALLRHTTCVAYCTAGAPTMQPERLCSTRAVSQMPDCGGLLGRHVMMGSNGLASSLTAASRLIAMLLWSLMLRSCRPP